MIAGDSFSWPSTQTAPVLSGKDWPRAMSMSSQHSASTREAWPWLKQIALSTPESPAGHLLADLLAGDPLVLAVGPLGQVLVHLVVAEAGQLGGAAGPQPGAGQHEPELARVQLVPQRLGLLDAVRRQVQVRDGGVLPGLAPFGLAVADQV